MTKIEWCDESWNPVVGCTPISDGCKNCYAQKIAGRFGMTGWDTDGPVLHQGRLSKPLSWRKPRRIFVNSMGDLFHPLVPFVDVEKVWCVMRDIPRHTFMVLTKRPQRMLEWYQSKMRPVLSNLWLGVTIENDRHLDRASTLMECPAAVRFISVEPMLGPVDLSSKLCEPDGEGIGWVIAGAETGQGKRPMDPRWFNDLHAECASQGVPFFGKKDSNRKPLGPREFPR